MKYKLGLALSGGGSKGIAHLGVLKALEEAGIMPDIISGTSAGSMAGAFFSDGASPKEILEMFSNKKFSEFGGFSIPSGGIFKTDRFQRFLESNLKARNFEDLSIPLVIVAADIVAGKIANFMEGNLIPAILASCAVPIVFTPVTIGDGHYVDGGIFKNFPVSTIRKDCDFVIGSNVSSIVKEEYKHSILHVAERSFRHMSVANTFSDRKLCDILIESEDVSRYGMFQLENLSEIYERGYKTAKNILEQNDTKLAAIL